MVGFLRVMELYFRRIADLRIDHDLKQKQIAAFLNMSANVYSRYERGDREIPVWAVIKLAEYYQTSTDYILGRTDNPSAPHA